MDQKVSEKTAEEPEYSIIEALEQVKKIVAGDTTRFCDECDAVKCYGSLYPICEPVLKRLRAAVGVAEKPEYSIIAQGDVMGSKSPPEIAEAVCEIGYEKTKLPVGKTFVLAVLAGVYIGFGAQLSTAVKVGLADVVGSGFTDLLGGAVFSVGLMLAVIGGAELFTGNNLIVAACVRRKATVQGVLKNWAIVYTGNFVGSVLLVLIMFASFYAYRDPGSVGALALGIANAKVNLHFVEALSRGIGCNWLVCLAVWLAVSSSDTIGKIFACFFPTTAFVAMGLEHSIANMYFITMGLFLKDWAHLSASAKLTWDGFIRYNLIPVTIGNIIGGALFVGILYWYVYLHKP